MPSTLDDTPIESAQKGRSRKAPGRGSVPLAQDDKDREIKRLVALLESQGISSNPPKAMKAMSKQLPTSRQASKQELRQERC